ncbi:non-ribosomal peptide synthetase [Kitasatospora sp. NPDC048540]|uniref:non-ribosomal peptide synthetase n=1 Tax=Kitasatospora sp. NPDC048540 TaxID=3155634 RepID=UPI0033DC199A
MASRTTSTTTVPVSASDNITGAYLARFRSVTDGSAGILPVTGAQRRFLLARRLDPHGRPDVVPLFFAFPRGAVDPDRLRAAALRLAARHPALRGRFDSLRGTPVLRLGPPSAEVRRIAAGPGESADDVLRRELAAWRPDGPALRLLLAAAPGDEEEILAVALDHAACDEQSLGIVTAGLSAAYGQPAQEQEQDHGPDHDREPDGVEEYRAAVELQLAAEAAASGGAARAHWAARLGALGSGHSGDHSGSPGSGRLPQPGARSAEVSTGMLTHRLPAATGAARGAVFPALLDAVSAAAHRLLGPGATPALGYPWGGRPAAAPPALGCFLNTLVHPATTGPAPAERTTPDAAPPATLEELSARWWDDLDHADTPFDEVVHAARSAGASWTGTLDGLLTFEDLHRRPPLVLGGAAGRETHLAGRPLAAPFAVSASHGEDLLVRFAWDRAHWPDPAAADAFAALLDTLRRHLRATAPGAAH